MPFEPRATSDYDSAYSAEYDECYHSVRDGAYNESLYKHIIPCLYHFVNRAPHLFQHPQYLWDLGKDISGLELALDSALCRFNFAPCLSNAPDSTLRALDICFGLGYNAFSLLCMLEKLSFCGSVEIYSPEKDSAIFKHLRGFKYPSIFREILDIDKILGVFDRAKPNTLGAYSDKLPCGADFKLHIFKGDALKMLPNLLESSIDMAFQDAFSPSKNAELWSVEYFSLLHKALKPQSIISTYSKSKAMLQNATSAHFKPFPLTQTHTRNSIVFVKI